MNLIFKRKWQTTKTAYSIDQVVSCGLDGSDYEQDLIDELKQTQKNIIDLLEILVSKLSEEDQIKLADKWGFELINKE